VLKILFLLSALAFGVAQAAPAPPAYTATMIPLLPGFTGLSANGINAEGDVVGTAYNESYAPPYVNNSHAILYHHGKLIDLSASLPPNTNSSANAINDFDEIIGSYSGGAFIYHGGHVQLFPDTTTYTTEFSAINDRGQIVGREQTVSNPVSSYPFLRQPNGTMVQIPPFKGMVLNPIAINNVGQIVALYYGGAEVPRGGAVLMQAGGRNPVDLGTLGADLYAEGLNIRGQVVGSSQIVDALGSGAPVDAFLYSGGTLIDLGSLYGFNYYDGGADGAAINDFGVIAGAEQPILGEDSVATVYTGGAWYNLNEVTTGLPSSFFLTYAVAINNAGVIVAIVSSEYQGGPLTQSFILTPVKATGHELLK
jgi:probable HAF family extracellular repeat protein